MSAPIYRMTREIDVHEFAFSSKEMENLNPQINEIATKLLSSKPIDPSAPLVIKFSAHCVIITVNNQSCTFKDIDNISQNLIGRTFSLKRCPDDLIPQHQAQLARVKLTQSSNQKAFEAYTEKFKQITDEMQKMIKRSQAYPAMIDDPRREVNCDKRMCEFNYNFILLQNTIYIIQNELDLYPQTGKIKNIELLLPQAEKLLESLQQTLTYPGIEDDQTHRPKLHLRSNVEYIHGNMIKAFERFQLTSLQKKLDQLQNKLADRKPYNAPKNLQPLQTEIKSIKNKLEYFKEQLYQPDLVVYAESNDPRLAAAGNFLSLINHLNMIENQLKEFVSTLSD